jgi:hypothetical protein
VERNLLLEIDLGTKSSLSEWTNEFENLIKKIKMLSEWK